MEVVASAPAKVILFGEHFVVYGEPAMVIAIDKRAYARAENRDDKRIYIHSSNLNLTAYLKEKISRLKRATQRGENKVRTS
jgi:mevalonate kinase